MSEELIQGLFDEANSESLSRRAGADVVFMESLEEMDCEMFALIGLSWGE